MFFWVQLKVVWPSIVAHLVVLWAVVTAGWYFWTRIHTNFKFKIMAPTVFAFTFSAFYWCHFFVTQYQNALFTQAQQVEQAKQQQAQQEFNKQKLEMIKAVDAIALSPTAITPEQKTKFNETFSAFVKSPEAKNVVANNLYTAYMCQKFFLEDLQAALTSKKFAKSADRAKCETYDGTFFGREKLVAPDMARANDESVQVAANTQRLPASDAKDTKQDLEKLKTSVTNQEHGIQNLKSLFE